jgi:DNA-binding transcriptional MocR family regulator
MGRGGVSFAGCRRSAALAGDARFAHAMRNFRNPGGRTLPRERRAARSTQPDGGMFVWVELPDGIDATRLLDAAIARNVASVPGAAFCANALRLAFVTVPPERIRAGVAILGELLRERAANGVAA